MGGPGRSSNVLAAVKSTAGSHKEKTTKPSSKKKVSKPAAKKAVKSTTKTTKGKK